MGCNNLKNDYIQNFSQFFSEGGSSNLHIFPKQNSPHYYKGGGVGDQHNFIDVFGTF